jgi:hypothetical protein
MSTPRFPAEPDYYRLPLRPAHVPTAAGFAVVPVALVQHWNVPMQTWVSNLYQLALQQAQAATRPSLLERDLLTVWN